ncbi:MAG: glycosyltransferase family 2 protein [bacterium]
MKISIITPSYNSSKTISDTIESVISQNYSDLEYIIVDGASTDNTKDIVSKYQGKINIKFVSEPDKGIYDAMNKGIGLATGEVIGIINSDDFYINNDVLGKVSDVFKDSNTDACYGDLVYIKDDIKNKIIRYWKAGEYKEWKLNYGWIPPHPTLFVRKSVYEKFGLFRLDLKIAADYELMLRLLKKEKIKISYIPHTLVTMRLGGSSSKNIKNRMSGIKELHKSWELNGMKVPTLFIFRQLLKIPQYLRRFKK